MVRPLFLVTLFVISSSLFAAPISIGIQQPIYTHFKEKKALMILIMEKTLVCMRTADSTEEIQACMQKTQDDKRATVAQIQKKFQQETNLKKNNH